MIFLKLIIIINSSLDTDANWQVTKTTVNFLCRDILCRLMSYFKRKTTTIDNFKLAKGLKDRDWCQDIKLAFIIKKYAF